MEKQPQRQYLKSNKKWKDFKILKQSTQNLLSQAQFFKPTYAQGMAINAYQEKQKQRFIMTISSMNGSGKTLCMLIPAINSIDLLLQTTKINQKKKTIRLPQILMCLPTVGLVQQTATYLKNFNKTLQKYKQEFQVLDHRQSQAIGQGQFQLGTTKKISKALQNMHISLTNLKWLLFDQFDQLLKNSEYQIESIIDHVFKQSKANIIIVSATLGDQKQKLRAMLKKQKITIPIVTIDTGKLLGQINLKGVKQFYKLLSKGQSKDKTTIQILKAYTSQDPVGQILIFFNKKKDLFNFQNILKKEKLKYTIGSFHGDLTETEKREMVGKIRNKSYQIVLATNIMARGIDIRTITLVINVDPPTNGSVSKPAPIQVATYVHRVGRTGRYEDKGVSLCLLQEGNKIGNQQQKDLISRVKKFSNCDIHEVKEWSIIFKQMKQAYQNNQKG